MHTETSTSNLLTSYADAYLPQAMRHIGSRAALPLPVPCFLQHTAHGWAAVAAGDSFMKMTSQGLCFQEAEQLQTSPAPDIPHEAPAPAPVPLQHSQLVVHVTAEPIDPPAQVRCHELENGGAQYCSGFAYTDSTGG